MAILDDHGIEVIRKSGVDLTNQKTTYALRVVLSGGSPLGDLDWDFYSVSYGATTDTYTFKTGGAGGSTVATFTFTYTDTTKTVISSGAWT